MIVRNWRTRIDRVDPLLLEPLRQLAGLSDDLVPGEGFRWSVARRGLFSRMT